jgi:hypothetical protein
LGQKSEFVLQNRTWQSRKEVVAVVVVVAAVFCENAFAQLQRVAAGKTQIQSFSVP